MLVAAHALRALLRLLIHIRISMGIGKFNARITCSPRTRPIDGSPVPFLQWTKAVNEAAAKDEAAGDPWSPNEQRCFSGWYHAGAQG